MLPDATPDDGIWVIDTGDLFAALEGEPGGNKRGLERICRHLQIPTEWLHNAGNDAHVCTLPDDTKSVVLMCSIAVHSVGVEDDGFGRSRRPTAGEALA
jgi:hypothetical protein